MNKYNEKTIYSGNIMKYINGQNILVKEGEFLIYDEKEDCFYTLVDTLNPSLDLYLNKNLTDKQKEEARKIIDSHKLPYINNMNEGNMYIDENTINIAIKEDKTKSR